MGELGDGGGGASELVHLGALSCFHRRRLVRVEHRASTALHGGLLRLLTERTERMALRRVRGHGLGEALGLLLAHGGGTLVGSAPARLGGEGGLRRPATVGGLVLGPLGRRGGALVAAAVAGTGAAGVPSASAGLAIPTAAEAATGGRLPGEAARIALRGLLVVLALGLPETGRAALGAAEGPLRPRRSLGAPSA